MPQLVKGGKYVFGWTLLNEARALRIPPEAWEEYGFTVGDTALFTRGSRTSGGFAISYPALLERAAAKSGLALPVLGEGIFQPGGIVTVPDDISVQAGQKLLVVRGSGFALGFLAQGPILAEALRHADVVTFTV
ncbi:MAG: hypothetical protein JW910_00970 [Anaerolineae bacterium]|nr:hypothetical protein [Anaerolineae bacterium]